MYKASLVTAALGGVIALGVLVTDAQADSGSRATRAQPGPVALNADQLDRVVAGSFFSVSALTTSVAAGSSTAIASGGYAVAFTLTRASSTTNVSVTSNSGD